MDATQIPYDSTQFRGDRSKINGTLLESHRRAGFHQRRKPQQNSHLACYTHYNLRWNGLIMRGVYLDFN